MHNSRIITLIDRTRVEINPHGYIPDEIFVKMKHSDYNKVMNDCHGYRKRNVQEINQDKSSIITTRRKMNDPANWNDSRSIQVSKGTCSGNRTIMGSRNE